MPAANDMFDAEGLPNRLPKTQEEALQFQFAASNWARKKNERMLQNAQASLRYGLGMINKFGPYSAASLMNPLLGQMAQAYMGMQYDQPDYSYFMRNNQQPIAPMPVGRFGAAGGVAPMSQWPVQMRWPQEAAAAPAPQWPSGPLGPMLDMNEPAPVIDIVGGYNPEYFQPQEPAAPSYELFQMPAYEEPEYDREGIYF